MAGLADVTGSLMPDGGTVGLIAIIIIVGVIVLLIVGLAGWLVFVKRKWNLNVEIKLPRSDSNIVNAEWGKGYFNNKRGVVYIKRPGFGSPKIPIKIFDPKRYLQGSSLMTVIQLSPVDYRPVLPESFLKHYVDYKDEKTGKVTVVKESILNIRVDTGHSKAWSEAFDAASRSAYTMKSFFTQFQVPIAVAMVVISVFIGITALWTQMPKG